VDLVLQVPVAHLVQVARQDQLVLVEALVQVDLLHVQVRVLQAVHQVVLQLLVLLVVVQVLVVAVAVVAQLVRLVRVDLEVHLRLESRRE
jgi:hypothetical protein